MIRFEVPGGAKILLDELIRRTDTDGLIVLHDGERVVQSDIFEELHCGGDRAAFAHAGFTVFDGWSYRSQWWISHDEYDSIRALGVHGQQLYVAPRAGLVIARFGSQKLAVDEQFERLLLAVHRGIAKIV